MTRKAMWVFAAIVVAATLVPQAVFAAVGSFSSANGTAAVNGNNTYAGTSTAPAARFTCKANGCRAVWVDSYGVNSSSYGVVASSRDATGKAVAGLNNATTGSAMGVYGQSASSTGRGVTALAGSAGGVTYGGFMESRSSTAGATGVLGWASSQAVNGATYGVFGKNDGGGPNSTGVFGFATKTAGNPQVNGVWGRAPSTNGAGLFGEGGAYGFYGAGGYTGGYGFGQQVGIAGDTCDNPNCIGDGSYGLLSYSDAGIAGHLVGTAGNVAGTCAVTGTNPVTCAFANPFPAPPIVVATPAGDYGSSSRWWIDSVSTTGFTIKRVGSSGNVTFNWMAIGLDSGMGTLAPRHLSRAQAAGVAR